MKKKNDLLFKKLFSSKGNEDILCHFINDFTGENFTNVQINNTYSIDRYKQELAEEKNDLFTTIVDVSATTVEGTEIIVEMQLHRHCYFIERTLFYANHAFNNAYSKREKYLALKPVFAINVVDFNLFNDGKFIRRFDIMDKEDQMLLLNRNQQPLMRLFYVMLPNVATKNTIQRYWQLFFKQGIVTSDAPDCLKRAQNIVDESNMTQEELAMVTRAQILRSDAEAVLEYAEEKGYERGVVQGKEIGIAQGKEIGIAQGREIGIAQGIIENIKKLLQNGMSKEDVIRMLDLTEEQIQKLILEFETHSVN